MDGKYQSLGANCILLTAARSAPPYSFLEVKRLYPRLIVSLVDLIPGSPIWGKVADNVSYFSDGLTIVLWGFSPHQPLPIEFVQLAASAFIKATYRIDRLQDTHVLRHHAPFANKKAEILVVFPGAPVPLAMGSHQRLFQQLYHLSSSGLLADVLLPARNAAHATQCRNILVQVCRRMHWYTSSRGKLPLVVLLRRWIEFFIQRCMLRRSMPSDLFLERLYRSGTPIARACLLRTIATGHYKAILIHYAWHSSIKSNLPKAVHDRIHWICDTIDVHHTRFATEANTQRRFLASSRRERKHELSSLRTFDALLCISESDKALLRTAFPNAHLISSPSGFDYALQAPTQSRPDAPVFGFIGNDMPANVAALKVICNSWWPIFLQRFPNATLHVAGTVCRSDFAKSVDTGKANIVFDGYISCLRSWYSKLHVVLNPVVVAGGLNFKSVEALMAGRLLVTTPLGTKCLGGDEMVSVVTSDKQLSTEVSALIDSPERFYEVVLERQNKAVHMFGDNAAFTPLAKHLRSILNDAHL